MLLVYSWILRLYGPVLTRLDWLYPASGRRLLSASICEVPSPSTFCSNAASLTLSVSAGSQASATRPPQLSARLIFLSRSEEHTSELQSLMRISYAVFCLKKKNFQS